MTAVVYCFFCSVISVASKAEHGFMVRYSMKVLKEENLNHTIAISLILDNIEELENGLECSTLQLLQVRSQSRKPNAWPEHFFQSMSELKVLTMQNLCIPKLPSLSQASFKLHTLQLENCDIRDISVIGKELLHLEILSFAYSNIGELPTEIGDLAFLRLLDLTGCNDLNFISTNVLPRLSRLEELYLRVENFPWKKNDVVIKELQNMSHQLKVVEMKVREVEILAKNLDFKNLEKFWVYLAPYTNFRRSAYLGLNLLEVTAINYNSMKCMSMVLLKKCEILILRKVKDLKNVIGELDDCELPSLKDLRLDSCSNLEYLIDYTFHCNAFPQIQSLSLKNLNNLREICHAFDHHEVKESMYMFLNLVKLELIALQSFIGFSKATDLNEPHQGLSSSTKLPDSSNVEDGEVLSKSHSKSGGRRSLPISAKLFSFNWMTQFQKLETILLEECNSLEMVFDLQGYSQSHGQPTLLFPQLKEIKMSSLNNLTYVSGNVPHCVQGFQNLRSLTISDCDSLRYVFTSAIARAIVNLEELEVNSCKSIENLVFWSRYNEEDDNKDKGPVTNMVFNKLHSVSLSKLPKLVSCCSDSLQLEWPSLRQFKIDDCPMLEISLLPIQINAQRDNPEVTYSANTKDTNFLNFEETNPRSSNGPLGCMSFLPKFIPQGNTKKKSSKEVSLARDNTPSIVKRQDMKNSFAQLESIHLQELPNLLRSCSSATNKSLDKQQDMGACEGDHARMRRHPLMAELLFPNLTSLIIGSCNKIIILFSHSSLRSLEHLEYLEVWSCKNMEEIVSHEEIETCENRIMLPQLQHLVLRGLPNFKAFCQGSFNFDFPSLQKVEIIDCLNMEMFSQGSSHTPKLEHVNMEMESHNSNYIQKKDLNATVQGFKAFVRLISVALQGDEMLRWTKLHNEGMFGYFMKNSEINITEFHNLSKLVSFNEIQMLQHVRKLTVRNCDSLVEVFESEGGEGAKKGDATTHYQLEDLTLENLPKLSHIWKDNIIKGVVSFQKLTSIYIEECHSLKSLFSHSMARSLVHLQDLWVDRCGMIEEIVTKEDENNEGGSKVKILFPELKDLTLVGLPKLECVCSGDYDYDIPLCDVGEDKEMNNNNIQISFPQLERLYLYEVRKLKCICSGGYDYNIMVSSIEECPKIATFPHGNVIVSAPNLHIVYESDLLTLGDLNLTIHYIQNSEKYKVELQILETFEGIEQHELLLGYITRQRELLLDRNHKLLNCIPSDKMHLFSHLEELTVRECGCLEEIFESNDYEGDDNSEIQYDALWRMYLYSLPKLKHIWNNHGQVLGFKNLESLTISHCHDLKYVFPDVSVARRLPKLWSIEVNECKKMEEIIRNNSNSDSIQQPKEAKITFPSLYRIRLKKLPSLNCFCPSSFSCYVELPQCGWIIIEECPKMETFSYGGTVYTPRLYDFRVDNTRFDEYEEVNEVIRHRK